MTISLAIEGAVAIATLCRPPVNAINEEWVARLGAVLDEVEAARQVSVLWIRSNQRAFSAGADLALMRSRFGSDEGRRKMVDFTRELQAVYARLEGLGKVSIAEIGGAAMGGGFELALACDLRAVADTAKVGLPRAPGPARVEAVGRWMRAETVTKLTSPRPGCCWLRARRSSG